MVATLSLTFLFAVMGMAVDPGWDYYLRTRVRTAADAAASAAAVYAKANGYSCGTTYTCAGTTPATTALEAGCLFGQGFQTANINARAIAASPPSRRRPAFTCWTRPRRRPFRSAAVPA